MRIQKKYITFLVPIKKETTKKDKDGNDKITKISYKITFIDSYRFMSTSLSNLVNNLSEGVHNDKCTNCKSCLDYMTTEDEQLTFRCFRCKKSYGKDFNKELIQRFANRDGDLNNGDLNKFILLLRKGAYPYEYMVVGKDLLKHHCPTKKLFIAT